MSASLESTHTPQHRSRLAGLGRITVLAGHTFTQLVRMKVFYFLLVFSVVIFAVGFLISSVSPDQELKLIKDTAFGSMQIFSWIFGIVGMALLLPKDLEDRTLYTILSKPVRRYEYLLGKYLGVLLVLLVSLAVMDVLCNLVLQLKYSWAVDRTREYFSQTQPGQQMTEYWNQELKDALASLAHHAPHWDLQLAVLAIFLKAAVITAVALLISTFSGSTIFTILVALAILVIGHLQSVAREAFLGTGGHLHAAAMTGSVPEEPESPSVPTRLASGVVAVLFPDFEVYGIVDAIANGQPYSASDAWKVVGLTALYLAIYLGLAALVFHGKEL